MKEKEGVVRILIADDHAIFRDGLKALLSGHRDFRVVGEVDDGSGVLKLLEKLKPDILLLDLRMPYVSGIDVLRLLAKAQRRVRTIVLCGDLTGEDISRAFELGARGLMLKSSATATLFNSIHAVMEGQYWIGNQSAVSPGQTLKQYKRSAAKSHHEKYGLTPREMQVLKAVVTGCPNKEIAEQLHISNQTVKHHITNIFDKVGVYNRLELTLFAFHHGMMEK
jgi:two-component system nitrate/nitrite response regulator NarL